MINGLVLGCSDLCLLRNVEKKWKKKRQKFFFGFYGISIPGHHPGLCGFSMYGDHRFFFDHFLIHSGQNDPDYVTFLQAWFAWLNH